MFVRFQGALCLFKMKKQPCDIHIKVKNVIVDHHIMFFLVTVHRGWSLGWGNKVRPSRWMLKIVLGNLVKAVEMVWGLVGSSKKRNNQTRSRQTNNDTMRLGCTHRNWHASFPEMHKSENIFNGSSAYQSDTLEPYSPRRTQPFHSTSVFLKQTHLQ